MPAYLITGNPGSGKSTVAAELLRRGFSAVDPDYDPDLSHWEAPDGRSIRLSEGPSDPDRAWLEAHRWVWDRARMTELVGSTDHSVFVCGIALNIPEVIDLFDALFLLEIDEHTQEERLAAHDSMNPPGRNEAGREQIRDGRTRFQSQMVELGAICVDGAQTVATVVDELLAFLDDAGS